MQGHYDDFWRLETDTTIAEEKDGAYTFEDTVFWGEKGGMPSDRGTINGLPITDLIWKDGVLWHRVDGSLSNPIHMQVDPDTRLTNTAAQSALHLVDGYVKRKGLEPGAVGVHEGDQWYEIPQDSITEEELDDIQEYMNQAILADVPVTFTYIPGKEYPDPAYQDLEQVRIVKFGTLDEQPCGTPHLQSTGEIGSVVITHAEKTSRGVRIHCVIGPAVGRALKDDETKLQTLEKTLKVSRKELTERVRALFLSEHEQKDTIKALQEKLTGYEAEALAKDDTLVIELPDKDGGTLRMLGQKIAFEHKKSKILVSEVDGKCALIFASAEGKARDWLNAVKESAQVRGGGSPQLVNGQSALSAKKLMPILKEAFSAALM